jgi:sigma-B regulation protein RsbU (phosphoserine phosphatase)
MPLEPAKTAGGCQEVIVQRPGLVLVVDDHEKNREICRINLELEEFDVILAEDGLQGYQRAENDKPDLILLDIMMPVMDGYEMLRRVRANPDLADTPVLMLTAKAASSDVVRALDLGANDYLKKPFDVEEMLARTRTLVSLKRAQDQIKSDRQRLAQELNLARKIQTSLIPPSKLFDELEGSGLRVFAFTRPASEVSGDFFDLRRRGSDGFSISLVDCKGHGVSAGMMTMAVHALLDSMDDGQDGPGGVLERLDDRIRHFGPLNEFAATSHLVLEPAAGRVVAGSAGLPFPLHYQAETGQVTEWRLNGGPPLGLPLHRPTYPESALYLEPGDKLILFTDGLTEAANDQNDLFGVPIDSLMGWIAENGGLPSDQMGLHLIESWDRFTAGHQDDDCTVLIIERATDGTPE